MATQQSSAAKQEAPQATTLAKQDLAISELFTNQIIREFGKQAGGGLNLTAYQKRLAQHLFIKIDTSLKDFETKRADRNKAPIVWNNVNMEKLAIDAMHRVELGLDALIPGHVYPIPYWNTSKSKYDLDLRVGYIGKDYYKRKMALEPPKDIIYELVHKNDKFVPIKKSFRNQVESYEFEITDPFNRGDVVGGFAYIQYEDDKKNRLIIVTSANFDKSKSNAKSVDFWNNYPDEMKYKTLVNRATNKLTVDPEKVNAAFMAVEQEEHDIEIVAVEVEKNANKGTVLRLEPATQEIETQSEPEQAQEEKKPDLEKPEEQPKAQGRVPGF